ncbi:thioredoxin domain-containing protein bug [Arctopsyche grandis]|uniref:thioredoxin domain-containing protein bug n=1 Tax=Arctopsyche grandis TaxID=121162 RepID=UPI00406D85CC
MKSFGIFLFVIFIAGNAANGDDDMVRSIELDQVVEDDSQFIPDETPSDEMDFDPEPDSEPRVVLDETSESPPSANETRKLVSCKLNMINGTAEERLLQSVEIINASRLAELLTPDADITDRESEAPCTVVLFFSKQCPFSYMAAPHFNSLARSFPDLKLAALDSVKHSRVNTQYGIVGVPSIILFHNARAVAKFNNSEYSIQAFIKFIKMYTGIQEESDTLRIKDFEGPVPREIDDEIDYFLMLACAFIILCKFYYISKTQIWKTMVETIKHSWREAEAQHEHTD